MASGSLTRTKVRSAWLFVLPMLAVIALVALWPLIRTFYFSMTTATLRNLDGSFVGLENFIDPTFGLMTDPYWWRSVYNTLFFSAVSVALETVCGLLVALLLHRNIPGRGFLRAAILVPWALPTIVAGRMWHWMLNDQFGIINAMLVTIGLIDSPIAWTASPNTAMAAMIIVDVWKTTPFMALMILAGLQMLPSDCYEAARIDGVHPLKVFWRVTLPLLQPAIVVAIVFRLLDTLRVFDLFYIMTTGTRDMMSMSMYARYQLIENQDVGYGSAISTALFAIIAIAAIAVIYFTRFRMSGDRS
ncbi:MAG: ABC transporter permease [Pelagibacterium sp. SCN 64-44]|nr:MAG: ABC transporter permease [Pelagibacterium sp. SCN 64-44]